MNKQTKGRTTNGQHLQPTNTHTNKMNRTSIKTLETLCLWINQAMGTPETPWVKTAEGRMVAQIGNFHLSGAYGGVCVHQMNNEGGGVTTPIWGGHIPKREAESLMRAYLRGLEAKKETK